MTKDLEKVRKRYGPDCLQMFVDELIGGPSNNFNLARKWGLHLVDIRFLRDNYDVLYRMMRKQQLRLVYFHEVT